MLLKLPGSIVQKIITDERFARYKRYEGTIKKLTKDRYGSRAIDAEIPAFMLDDKVLDKVLLWAKEDPKASGHNYLIQQLNQWAKVKDSPETATFKSLSDFYGGMQQFAEMATTNRLLVKKDIDGNWLPYLITSLESHKNRREDGEKIPARIDVKLKYVSDDKSKKDSFSIRQTDLETGSGKSKTYIPLNLVLAERGYYPVSKELAEELGDATERFAKLQAEVGKLMLADGHGRTYDFNDDTDYYWYTRGTKWLPMLREGAQARLVVDDVTSEDKRDRDNNRTDRYWSWYEDDEQKDSIDYEELTIPVHPQVILFDLEQHTHYRVHIDNLTEYVYNPALRDKLVLPEGHLELVDLLIGDGSGSVMEDIVAGKSGGIIVLASGVPGTGKTLTAEIYSETIGKPLYSVQCSQLGLDPKELEEKLQQVLNRSVRWGAILLLDEADVYIRERGTDVIANAMVGCFLRLLERFKGILWLTTNMTGGDGKANIDDAIVSRCSAHLRYGRPERAEAVKLWSVLSHNYFGVTLTEGVIDSLVAGYPGLTGRNVKQLCKLGALLKVRKGEDFTIDTVKRLSQFVDITR